MALHPDAKAFLELFAGQPPFRSVRWRKAVPLWTTQLPEIAEAYFVS